MAEKGEYTYDYPRPMLTVDAVVFTVKEGRPAVLLIKRKYDPFAGRWALPGGFVEMEESLLASAARELFEEAGLSNVPLDQMHTFGDPGRDPRGRSISVAFLGIVDWRIQTPRADDDADDVAWTPVTRLPELAFDHSRIVEYAVRQLRRDPRYVQAIKDLRR